MGAANTGASPPSELATMRLVRITSDSSTISGISAGATSAGSSHLLLDPAVVRSSGDRGAPTSPQITPKGGDKQMWDTDMDAGDAAGRGGLVGPLPDAAPGAGGLALISGSHKANFPLSEKLSS